ncbi:MAG: tripartite tricarboxylate transporter substrate binding protein [Azoarcus sp.]|jgi:tripartite-type tricarboxylate transporter receptor subunit TctC|nr:tripartite tricarboxylate transporter substrate binding protein [Azoarcus sp.]MDX9839749.1 tripartite tricarboxylate transporter substrate binding protein [Azoarcus sp.]
MSKIAKSLLAITTAVAVTLTGGAAFAEYPEKPVNVIVPWGAGGDSDLTTRLWADAMEGALGTPVVVINKAGGGGVIGTTFVASSKNDGYTLVNAGLSNVLVTPNFSKTPYDFSSFVPVVKLSSVPLGILVPADSPYKTFDDFIAAAKAGRLTQGSWGAASSGTVLASIIADQAGYDVKFVHGNTTAESMVALIGGHIDSAVSFPPAFGPHVKSGRARLLVLNQKMAEYPNVPTFADYGIKGSFEGWSGVFAPKGTPPEVIQKLVNASGKVMDEPKVRKAFENMGANVDFRHGEAWTNDMLLNYDIMKNAAAKMKQ